MGTTVNVNGPTVHEEAEGEYNGFNFEYAVHFSFNCNDKGVQLFRALTCQRPFVTRTCFYLLPLCLMRCVLTFMASEVRDWGVTDIIRQPSGSTAEPWYEEHDACARRGAAASWTLFLRQDSSRGA